MRAIQLYVNSFLPDDLKDYTRTYDKKSVNELFGLIADRYPERFEELSKKFVDAGRMASYLQAETLTLDDMQLETNRDAILAQMDKELDIINKDKSLSTIQKGKKRIELYGKYSDVIQKDMMESAFKANNNLTNTIISGARGSPGQLRAMVATPAVYMDYKDEPIPMFIRNSFGEGLRPHEQLASVFGARKGVLATKNSVSKSGDLLKQMIQVSAREMVTEEDCGTSNGIDIDIEDDSLRGRVLLRETNGIPAGSLIDKHVIKNLRDSGLSKVMTRSALTCQAKEGLCSHCHGALPGNKQLPSIGYSAGITASQGIGEPLTQGALNCLAKGTRVRMADFSTRNIEDINPGEFVLGSDVEGNTFPVKVTYTWDQGLQPVYEYTYSMGQTKQDIVLRSTECHPILSITKNYGNNSGKDDNKPKKIVAGFEHNNLFAVLPNNTFDYGDKENCSFYTAKRKSIRHIGNVQCFDLTVEHKDSLFVLENGLIVSNTKHSGGSIQQGSKKKFSGFDVINQIMQTPEAFPDRTAVSEEEGTVTSIEAAPQGGYFVHINDTKHYVLPGQDLLVKVGQQVEKGAELSNGLTDTYDIVRLRGLGEGRKHFTDTLKNVLKDSGINTSTRNLEIFAKAAINQIDIKNVDDNSPYLPDDSVFYNSFVSQYRPPKNATLSSVDDKLAGRYLEQPVLHYTIGTRLTPSMVKRIKENDFKEILTSDVEPSFEPSMVRLRTASHAGDDWMAKMHSSLLGRNIKEDAFRARDTNYKENIHFAPRLAFGENFGENIKQTGKF